jgi:hypothetical protein
MNIELLDSWMRGMKKAWETKDPQAAADLCSDKGFLYYESQFREPLTTKEEVVKVWEKRFKDMSGKEFEFNILATNKRGGVVHWRVDKAGLDGVFAVKLDTKGLCTEFRQWWMEKERS